MKLSASHLGCSICTSQFLACSVQYTVWNSQFFQTTLLTVWEIFVPGQDKFNNLPQEILENKHTTQAACRPFPLQLHQKAKSTRSAKLPLLLNQWCNFYILLDLLWSPVRHSLFYDLKHHIQPFGHGGAVKIFSQRFSDTGNYNGLCRAAPGFARDC